MWEELARASIAQVDAFGHRWQPASRWWGPGLDRQPMEVDVVSESDDGRAILLGEARWGREIDVRHLAAELHRKAEAFPLTQGRTIHLAAWVPAGRARDPVDVFSAREVMTALR